MARELCLQGRVEFRQVGVGKRNQVEGRGAQRCRDWLQKKSWGWWSSGENFEWAVRRGRETPGEGVRCRGENWRVGERGSRWEL